MTCQNPIPRLPQPPPACLVSHQPLAPRHRRPPEPAEDRTRSTRPHSDSDSESDTYPTTRVRTHNPFQPHDLSESNPPIPTNPTILSIFTPTASLMLLPINGNQQVQRPPGGPKGPRTVGWSEAECPPIQTNSTHPHNPQLRLTATPSCLSPTTSTPSSTAPLTSPNRTQIPHQSHGNPTAVPTAASSASPRKTTPTQPPIRRHRNRHRRRHLAARAPAASGSITSRRAASIQLTARAWPGIEPRPGPNHHPPTVSIKERVTGSTREPRKHP